MLKEFSRLGIIADDLTGANDTGAQFAKYGLATVVSLDAIADERLFRAADVIVVNTDSRLVLRQKRMIAPKQLLSSSRL